MRSTRVSVHQFFVSSLLVVVAACSENAAKPVISEPRLLEPSLSLVPTPTNCPDPYLACQQFHGPYSVPTNACEGAPCFEMNYGAEMRLVAADDQGDFPRTFFVWHEGTMQPAGSGTCLLTNTENKNVTKTRLDIPEGKTRCADNLTVGEHLYHEHFASNPASGCMGWIECTEVVP